MRSFPLFLRFFIQPLVYFSSARFACSFISLLFLYVEASLLLSLSYSFLTDRLPRCSWRRPGCCCLAATVPAQLTDSPSCHWCPFPTVSPYHLAVPAARARPPTPYRPPVSSSRGSTRPTNRPTDRPTDRPHPPLAAATAISCARPPPMPLSHAALSTRLSTRSTRPTD